MSFIIHEVYINCSHIKSEQVIDCARHPNDTSVTYHKNLITEPGMCAPCLRKVESDFDKEVEGIVHDIVEGIKRREHAIAQADDSLGPDGKEEGEWDLIDKLNDEINQLVHSMEEVKKKANERLRVFRLTQGYFADG